MNFLNKEIVIVPEYKENMFNESMDNLDYYIDKVKKQIQNIEQDNKQTEDLGRILDIFPSESKDNIYQNKKVLKKLISYLQKDYILIKRRYAKEDKYQREKEKANKILSKIQDKNIQYLTSDANKKVLVKVIEKLKLYNKINNKSVIRLYTNSKKVNIPSSDNRYEFWDIIGEGYINIDGIEYSYSDLFITSGGYDHFPSS